MITQICYCAYRRDHLPIQTHATAWPHVSSGVGSNSFKGKVNRILLGRELISSHYLGAGFLIYLNVCGCHTLRLHYSLSAVDHIYTGHHFNKVKLLHCNSAVYSVSVQSISTLAHDQVYRAQLMSSAGKCARSVHWQGGRLTFRL